jgi:hypothetical protein
MSWGYNQVFIGRAALLHLGAFTATIMTANVFLIIMPNQRIVVGDLKAGRKPDPKYGKIAKLRSTHNNYLTLPVIFLMLSNHYPLAFGTQYAWIIATLFQLNARAKGTADLDLGRYGHHFHRHGVAVVVPGSRHLRGRGIPRPDPDKEKVRPSRRILRCRTDRAGALFHVPCTRAGLGRHSLGTQGRFSGN